MLSRRSLLGGLGSLLMSPAIVHAGNLMPISSRALPKLKYIVTDGLNIGSIEEVVGTPPAWMLPCDGRTICGAQYPNLFMAVRGYAPGEDSWLNIQYEEGHKLEMFVTIDRWSSMSMASPPIDTFAYAEFGEDENDD